jgi:apolipoprotein N-acyltransferase
LIINVTNDGWFGNTPGPYQHFAQARLRAIELGLPLIRVANTGISAVIDPYGRVIGSLPLGVAGVIDSDLPASIRPTVFSAWPRLSLLACFAFLFAAYLVSRARF